MTFYLIDHDGALTQSLATLLSARGLHIEIRSSGEDFLANFDPERATCVLVAAQLPDMSTAEFTRRLGLRGVEIPVILVDASGAAETKARTIVSALGGLPNQWDENQHPDTLDPVRFNGRVGVEGRSTVPSASTIPPIGLLRERYELLTAREREVAKLAAEGHTSKELARRLHLSKSTVDNHRAHILAKLELDNFLQVARFLAALPAEP